MKKRGPASPPDQEMLGGAETRPNHHTALGITRNQPYGPGRKHLRADTGVQKVRRSNMEELMYNTILLLMAGVVGLVFLLLAGAAETIWLRWERRRQEPRRRREKGAA